jgi:hypothetical protein
MSEEQIDRTDLVFKAGEVDLDADIMAEMNNNKCNSKYLREQNNNNNE